MHHNKKENLSIQTIALLSDIHGNLPALEAVCQHAIEHGAQLFLNAGDTVGFGPFPNECLDFIRIHRFHSVKGDFDQKVLEFPTKRNVFELKKHYLRVFTLRWAYEQLSRHNFEFLSALPEFSKIGVGIKMLYLTHGSPRNPKAHLGPNTSRVELLFNQRHAKSDFIVTGNSHFFWKEQLENTIFINPGSVGRQDDGDPRASYAILSLGDPIRVTQFRVTYNVARVIHANEVYNLPVEFSYMFENGVNLERALADLSKMKDD
ncbi:MAG: metallophosphoesterase family protein [Pelolinea sp.]|jgi:putative phosphoesterase|nr:metallophosphoesterase family protein [Pelolinea sp.]